MKTVAALALLLAVGCTYVTVAPAVVADAGGVEAAPDLLPVSVDMRESDSSPDALQTNQVAPPDLMPVDLKPCKPADHFAGFC